MGKGVSGEGGESAQDQVAAEQSPGRGQATRLLSQSEVLVRLRDAAARLRAPGSDTGAELPNLPAPTLICLTGEEGTGKSWLLDKFRAERSQLVPAVTRPPLLANLLAAAEPLLTHDMHPEFIVAAQQLLPGGSWSYAAVPRSSLSREDIEVQLSQALLRCARRLGGLILQLDDLHDWNVEETAALARLWRRLLGTGTPVMLVVATRHAGDWFVELATDAAALGGCAESLGLAPLSEEELNELAVGFLDRSPAPEGLVGWLQARSQGVPLHALELLRFLLQGGALGRSGVLWSFREPPANLVPEGLARLLAARVAAFDGTPAATSALETIAVLGRPVGSEELARFVERSVSLVTEGCQSALDQGLLHCQLREGQARWSLATPLLTGPLLRGTDERRLRELHSRIAVHATDPCERAHHGRRARHEHAGRWTREALEFAYRRNDFGQLRLNAHVLLESGESEDFSRLHYYAALAAHSTGDLDEAIDQAERSAEPEALELRVLALIRRGRYEEALADIRSAPDGLPEPLAALIAGRELGMLLALGRQEEAARLIDARLEETTEDSRMRAEILIERARLYSRLREYGRQLTSAQEALSIYERIGARPNRLAWSLAGTAARHVGRPQYAREQISRYLEDARRDGDSPATVSGSINLGAIGVDLEEFRKASGHFGAGLQLAEAYGLPFERAQATANLTGVLLALGSFEDAVEMGERARELHHRLGHGQYASYELSAVALAEAALGHQLRARELLDGLRQGAREFVNPYWECAAHLVLGDPGSAARVLGSTNERGAHWHLWSGATALKRDDSVLAGEHLTLARQLAEVLPVTRAQADELLRLMEGESSGERAGAREGGSSGPPSASADDVGGESYLQREAPGALEVLRLIFPAGRRRAEGLHGAGGSPIAATTFLHCFGGLELWRDGAKVNWRGRKPRELLAYLLTASVSERAGIGRDELMNVLWPEAPESGLPSLLRVTVGRLRRALGGSNTVVRTNDGRYRLGEVDSEVRQFLAALSRYDLEGALGWYRGPYLGEMQLPGIEAVRESLRERFRLAACDLALESPPARAAQIFERLLADDPYDVDSLMGLLRALERSGEHAAMRRRALAYEELYRQELGEVPTELARLLRSRTATG